MKKTIRIVIIIFLIGFISYLAYNIYVNLQHKAIVAERIKTIPAFSFKTLNGNNFTQNNINHTNSKLFIYFNSECEFCNSEAQQIQNNLEALRNTQVIFISHESSQNIKIFAKKYQLLNIKNIVFLEDSKLEFSDIFNAKTIPFILLYGKDNKLIKKSKGTIGIEKIITLLK